MALSERSQGRVVLVMFRNDRATCDLPEVELFKMQQEYKGIDFYQVDTAKAPDIRDKYADSGNKPFFRFYRNGEKFDQVDYNSNFNSNKALLKTLCARHDSDQFNRVKYTLARASFKAESKALKLLNPEPVQLLLD